MCVVTGVQQVQEIIPQILSQPGVTGIMSFTFLAPCGGQMHGSMQHSTPPASLASAVCTDQWANSSDPAAPSWYYSSYLVLGYCEKGCAIRDGYLAGALRWRGEHGGGLGV